MTGEIRVPARAGRPGFTVRDADRDGVHEKAACFTRWHGVTRSTGVRESGVIVWYAWTIDCCPPHEPPWHWQRIPRAWDPSGHGAWAITPGAQCGNCGQLSHPRAELLCGEDEDAIARAAEKIVKAEIHGDCTMTPLTKMASRPAVIDAARDAYYRDRDCGFGSVRDAYICGFEAGVAAERAAGEGS